MRRKIKSELKNLTTNEITNHNSNCIVNQNKIKYQDNDTSYEIRIKNNEIIDQDIDEALALERKFDEKLFDIANEISS